MSKHKEIFESNLKRVESLCSIYTQLRNDKESDVNKEYRFTDMLRAATVFLHSSFEEYFRRVLIEWLPVKGSEETLKTIPISLKAGKRAEKLFLNDLAHYRDRSVNDIIEESVAESMKLTSFNSEEEIRLWCSKIGIDLGSNHNIREIDKAVKRRHKIVHEADLNRDVLGSSERLRPIRPGEITPWIEAYRSLVNVIESKITEWEEEK